MMMKQLMTKEALCKTLHNAGYGSNILFAAFWNLVECVSELQKECDELTRQNITLGHRISQLEIEKLELEKIGAAPDGRENPDGTPHDA